MSVKLRHPTGVLILPGTTITKKELQENVVDATGALQFESTIIRAVDDLYTLEEGKEYTVVTHAPPPPAEVKPVSFNTIRGNAPPGMTHFVKDLDQNFTLGIPDYVDYHGLRKLLTQELGFGGGEPSSILMMDVPGAGKTTTVFRAAVDMNACYIRVKASLTSILVSLSGKLKGICEGLPDNMNENSLKEEFYPSCYGALLRIFQQAKGFVENGEKRILNIPFNGVINSTLDDVIGSMMSVFKALEDRGDSDPIVILHVDELQTWAVKFDFLKTEFVSRVDYESYTLIAFSNALARVVNAGKHFRVAMTGTNAFQGETIVMGSELKVKLFNIPQMPVRVTEELMNRYLNLPNLGEHELAGLCFQLSSNARALQYFLAECQRFGHQLTTDQVTMSSMHKWIESAFDQWTGTISDKIKHASSEWIAWFILICTQPMPNVQVFGDSIKIPVADVPPQFLQAAQQGLLQLSQSAGLCTIPKPKGFLLRYFTIKAKNMDKRDLAQVFAWTFAAATEKIGSPGHLFERLVSAELTIPISSLYAVIIKSLGAKGLLMADYRVSLKPVKYAATIASLKTLESQVHCVLDCNASFNRVVDIGVPMSSIRDKSEVNLYIDAKTLAKPNALWKACYSFFNDQNIPQDSPRIFLSLNQFQNSAQPKPRATKNANTVSAAFAFTEVKKILALKQTCSGGWLKFAILDGEENFSECQLMISLGSIKTLESIDITSSSPNGTKPFMDAMRSRKRSLEEDPLVRSDSLSWFRVRK